MRTQLMRTPQIVYASSCVRVMSAPRAARSGASTALGGPARDSAPRGAACLSLKF
ncbi:MAG: hypothetical protein IPK82_07285 [Polyangiaceae bacterium]|nr:hypothetical protein [Polyangiaceae bacterium]